MSDDIVTRLRANPFVEGNGCGEYGCVTWETNLNNADLTEAADEIERLRKQVARLELQILANLKGVSHD